MEVFATESEDLGLIPGIHRVKVSSSENYGHAHVCIHACTHSFHIQNKHVNEKLVLQREKNCQKFRFRLEMAQ